MFHSYTAVTECGNTIINAEKINHKNETILQNYTRKCVQLGAVANNTYIVLIKKNYELNKIHIPFIYNYIERLLVSKIDE